MISRTVGVVKPNDRTMTDNSYYTRLTYEYKVSTLLFHRQAWRCDLVHQKVPPPPPKIKIYFVEIHKYNSYVLEKVIIIDHYE